MAICTMTHDRIQTTVAGERIATVGRDGSRMARMWIGLQFPIWTGKIYEAMPRRDGVLTWRLVGTFGGTRSGNRPSAAFVAELEGAAEHPFDDDGIVHGQICD